jgi:ATP/maltotriose-dependent transcriptional regulator MalT
MSEVDAFALVELGLFKNAAASIDSQTISTKELRVLRARLESHIGSPVRARNSAEALLREHLTASERTQCYDIVGRVAMSFGQIEAGTKAMRAAVNSAAQAQSPKLEARVMASNAEILLHSVAIEAAAEEIPKLRRACIASGDSYSLIAFHKLVAEIKAKKGLAAAARISLNAARGLLKSWPNVWQQGRLAVTASGIEIIQSDYDSALEYTNEALLCAEKSGSNEIRMAALGNLAHIKLAHGELDVAREANQAFQSMVRVGGSTEIGGCDTEMEIALATDDLELAKQLAEKVTRFLPILIVVTRTTVSGIH